MDNYIFRNREALLLAIANDKETPILDIYGESGIGKTRLLDEAMKIITQQTPRALILNVDLSTIATIDNVDLKKEKLLELLVTHLQGAIGQIWTKKYNQAVGQIVADLLVGPRPVYIVFDTTEKIQEDSVFWAWLEEYFIGPLVVRGAKNVKQIFAGRMPAPFQRHEVRRSLRLVRLEPLDVNKEAKQLIEEVLKAQSSPIAASEQNAAVDFILGFSFGHPGLSIELAKFIVNQLPLNISPDLYKQICEVIDRYVKGTLLERIDSEWVQILRLASILDWFDPYILRKYTEALLPDVAANKTEAFYIQGIASMRRQKSVIWSEQQGDRLHGVIREIIRREIQVESEFQFDGKSLHQTANMSAASIIEDLKKQAMEAGETDIQAYEEQIQKYTQRAKGEGSDV